MLVTGASGFVGSLLIPRLQSEGHVVRALGRSPERIYDALARSRSRGGIQELEVIRGDALTGEGLDQALEGVEVAYYLIHSMESPPSGGDAFSGARFAERDACAAESFTAAAVRAGARRIVYLGGFAPDAAAPNCSAASLAPESLSPHLASRRTVEAILLGAIPDSVALRASIVIGARSRSFRLLVHLVERLPVLALPAWRRFRTQPIDARDAIEMLVAAATAPLGGSSLDIAGPDALTYEEMLNRIAELMLVGRPALRFGVNMTGLTAPVVAAIAGEDPELVVALMEGLQSDLLPADDRAAHQLGVTLHSFDAAVEHALGEWEEFESLAAR